MASLQAAATSLRDARPPDDPVLHLLLDVRLPADRRPDLGARRRPRPGLHDGRDRRPDDAHRRGPPARRRPLATSSPRPSRTSAPTTRPSPTSSRRSSATASSGCTRRARTSSTTSRSTTRTTPSRRSPRASTRGSSAASTGSREAPDLGPQGAPGAARRLGLDPPAGRRRPGAARREVRDRRRDLLRAVVPAAPPRRARGRALEPAPSRRETPRVPYVSTVLGPDGGPIIAATDWLKALPDMVVALAAAVLRLARAPTASAGATPARRCGRCSRSTRRTSPRRRSPSWPAAAALPADEGRGTAIARAGRRPGEAGPASRSSRGSPRRRGARPATAAYTPLIGTRRAPMRERCPACLPSDVLRHRRRSSRRRPMGSTTSSIPATVSRATFTTSSGTGT